jgi:hypothetical protein
MPILENNLWRRYYAYVKTDGGKIMDRTTIMLPPELKTRASNQAKKMKSKHFNFSANMRISVSALPIVYLLF